MNGSPPRSGPSVPMPRWPPTNLHPRGSTSLRRSEEHTSELQSRLHLVCRLLLEKKKDCEVEAQKNLPYTDLPIGIDMGLKHFMTDSNSDVVDNPRFFRESHGRLKNEQQPASYSR